jgi:hypothetical protein
MDTKYLAIVGIFVLFFVNVELKGIKNVILLILFNLFVSIVLDLSESVDLRRDEGRQLGQRSVNLSFFVPAFSLFALASQFMPSL